MSDKLKVYILIGTIPYESNDIIAVCSNIEKAEERKLEEENTLDSYGYYEIEEWWVDEK